MFRPQRMKFGVFIGPYHPTNENPTVAFERDLDVVQWLDRLAFDEAWIGEHHSGGWETISAPDLVIATLAERTKHIRLGTGVVPIPFHHPLMVANRLCLLDHLTRGRIQVAMGPGLLMSDHLMLGRDPTQARKMWEEGTEALYRLLTETEPISMETDWFKLKDAMLQVRPYQQPHFPLFVASGASPAGVALAGQFTTGVLTFGANLVNPRADTYRRLPLDTMWDRVEEGAAKHGRTLSRDGWRFAVPVYLAQTKKEAFDDVRIGAGRWVKEYLGETLGQPVSDLPLEEILELMVEEGRWIVGTPDDCVEKIENLLESSGGFGGLICINLDWAPHHKILQSYELLARYVAPRYQGSLESLNTAQQWHSEHRHEMIKLFQESVSNAERRHAAAAADEQPVEAR